MKKIIATLATTTILSCGVLASPANADTGGGPDMATPTSVVEINPLPTGLISECDASVQTWRQFAASLESQKERLYVRLDQSWAREARKSLRIGRLEARVQQLRQRLQSR